MEILHRPVNVLHKLLRVHITHISSHNMVAKVIPVHTRNLLVELHSNLGVKIILQPLLKQSATAKVTARAKKRTIFQRITTATITTHQEYLVLTAHVLSLSSKARTALLRAHAHTALHIAALHLTTKTGVFHIRTKVCTSRFIQSKILNIRIHASVSIPPCKVVKAFHASFPIRHPFIIIHAHLLILINQSLFHCSLIVMLAHFICLVTQSISPGTRTPFLFSSLKSFLHRFWTTTPGKTLNLLDSMLHFMQYRRLHLPGTRVFRHLTRVHNNLADIILVNIKHTGDVTITRNLITTSILKPQANILQLRISLEQLWCVHIGFQRMIVV